MKASVVSSTTAFFFLTWATFAAAEWFVVSNYSGKCEPMGGPAEMIEIQQQLKRPYKTHDVTEKGQIVETTLVLPADKVQITWYRTKERCEQALSQKKGAQQKELDKYR